MASGSNNADHDPLLSPDSVIQRAMSSKDPPVRMLSHPGIQEASSDTNMLSPVTVSMRFYSVCVQLNCICLCVHLVCEDCMALVVYALTQIPYYGKFLLVKKLNFFSFIVYTFYVHCLRVHSLLYRISQVSSTV